MGKFTAIVVREGNYYNYTRLGQDADEEEDDIMSGPHFKSDIYISFISVKLLTCNLQVFLIHNLITGHMTTEYLKIHFRAQSCTKIYVD